MACVVVPVTQAVVTTLIRKAVKSKEEKAKAQKIGIETNNKIPFSKKLGWLNNMLWGGSALLIFEHIWHGEIIPWYPFLTGASNPAEVSTIFTEMATAGVLMSAIVTAVWGAIVLATNAMEKKELKADPAAN